MINRSDIILGAGMTGLAAGFVSGLPVFEANGFPGGICSSYFLLPEGKERLAQSPDDGNAYHFEIGGGHWIFGYDQELLNFLGRFVALKNYTRKSSVYFHKSKTYVPYPLQNHLRYLDDKITDRALKDMEEKQGSFRTMKEWLRQSFGPTLCDLFFYPFHELYTAGLYNQIAPQDAYKSPVDLSLVRKGASEKASDVGYNVSFVYPYEGLNTLAYSMAKECEVEYNKKVVKIDVHKKEIFFEDTSSIIYDKLVSTLPLNKIIEISGIKISVKPDPYTSVLVLNIGAIRGPKCPDDHWLYTPDSKSGFHRIGFYSNVDSSFLPKSSRENGNKVSIYVESAFQGGLKPSKEEIQQYSCDVIQELREWDFIGDTEVVDPTWIDVAYTWSWPDSQWKQIALAKLEKHNIFQIGRYGRWTFQGIADSIREGLSIPSLMK